MVLNTIPTPTFSKGRMLWIVIVLVGIALIATMPEGIFSELSESVGDIISTHGLPNPSPMIVLNAPNETERKQLADVLIGQGYKEEEIGEINSTYNKSDIPKMIPISGSVVIQDLEIIGNDTVRFIVKNVAKKSVNMPLYTVDAQIFVEHPVTGKPRALELKRMGWVEIGEEKMKPEEERVIIIKNFFDKLIASEAGYKNYYNTSSVKIVYEEFLR